MKRMNNKYEMAYIIIRNRHYWDIPPGHPMYCCQLWVSLVNHLATPIGYHPWRRLYYLMALKQVSYIHVISKCWYCGYEFPKDLLDIRNKILKKEYRITNWQCHETNKQMIELGIVDEFFTEKWWRKRGL